MGKKNKRWMDEKNRWMVGWTGKKELWLDVQKKIDGWAEGRITNRWMVGWIYK